MRTRVALLLALMAGAGPAVATAQDEAPAVSDFEMPAVRTDVPEPPAAAPRRPAGSPAPAAQELPGAGTTVIGEREAPIGLYIMPWRQSQAAAGLDRPARLLDVELRPLDPEVFRRQVEYHRALSEHLEKTGRATP